jgi:uncharacterized protein YqeY
MALKERLDQDLKAAMREGDTIRRDTIRLVISSLRNAEIENRGTMDAEGEDRVVAREIKQRRDSITEYQKAGRTDLADREQAELDVLKEYQPAQLSAEDVRAIVAASIARLGATGMSDIGRVMKDVLAETKGRTDGGAVNAAAREILSGAAKG